MALSLCPSCNRHVRGDACPFCGARAEITNEGSSSPRALRAIVVFGVAATIATSACGLANGYGGPPPDDPHNTPTATPDAGTD